METEIYLISYCDYEHVHNTVMEGPVGLCIEEYCKPLLSMAAQMALEAVNKNYEELGTCWIDEDDIHGCLVQILETKGFKKLEPKETCIHGEIFWSDPSLKEDTPSEELVDMFGQELAQQLIEVRSRKSLGE